jgi:hypothetical protein
MKRAKIMLTSIVVLAIVSGALAFKANSKFDTTFCYLTTVGNPAGGTCTTTSFTNSKTSTTGSRYWYITKEAGIPCDQHACVVSTSLVKE